MNKANIPEILLDLGFGVRPLGFEDFEIACAHLKFPFFIVDEKHLEEGVSFPRTRGNRRFRVIVLKNTLIKQALDEVCWHEFGHTYYEHFGVRCFVAGTEDKYEREADDFSLCCRIPTLWVRTKTREELLDEGFTPAEIDRRKEIYDRSKGKM